jgi:large subunit GTPase 1
LVYRLQEQDQFLLTPFERNLEVWRQLWRVLERSHLIVQIVDARNPLRFRCEDLEAYVQDIEGTEGEEQTGRNKRRSLLLINKADLLTAAQRSVVTRKLEKYHTYYYLVLRLLWADYFDTQGVQYAFFSAANATALQEARRQASAEAEAKETLGAVSFDNLDGIVIREGTEDDVSEEEMEDSWSSEESRSDDEGLYLTGEETSSDGQDPRAKMLSVLELEDLFVKVAPDLSSEFGLHRYMILVSKVKVIKHP